MPGQRGLAREIFCGAFTCDGNRRCRLDFSEKRVTKHEIAGEIGGEYFYASQRAFGGKIFLHILTKALPDGGILAFRAVRVPGAEAHRDRAVATHPHRLRLPRGRNDEQQGRDLARAGG